MGTVIRMIFREGTPKHRKGQASLRRSLARERGLTLWRERADLVIAAAYRVSPVNAGSAPDEERACIQFRRVP